MPARRPSHAFVAPDGNKNRTHTAPLDLPEGVTSIEHINAHYHCSRSRKVPDTTLDSEITFVLINPVMHPAGQA